MSRPNIVFVFGDQHRAQTTGFSGNPNVQTPHMDTMAREGVVFKTAVSNTPVYTPWRAAFLTSQYPFTNGVFLNDVRLSDRSPTLGTVLRDVGLPYGLYGQMASGWI